MGMTAKISEKDKMAEMKRRFAKYLLVMRASKARKVFFAFGTAPDGDDDRGFFMSHEIKSPVECLSRLKDQAKEWDLKIDVAAANIGTIELDEKGFFVFSCEKSLRSLKASLKKYLAQVGANAVKFRLQAPGGEMDSDEGDGAAAAVEPAAAQPPVATAAGPDSGAKASGAGMPATPDLYKKARTAWVATREMIVRDLDRFVAAVREQYAGEPDFGAIEANVGKLVSGIKTNIDDGLATDLDRASAAVSARDEGAWRIHRDAVAARIAAYRRYRDSEPALREIEGNPLVSVAVVQRLDRTLGVLAGWLA